MKLAINGWRLHGQRTGVGRYLQNVIRYWDRECLDRHGFATARLYTSTRLPALPDHPALDVEVLGPNARMLIWEPAGRSSSTR